MKNWLLNICRVMPQEETLIKSLFWYIFVGNNSLYDLPVSWSVP